MRGMENNSKSVAPKSLFLLLVLIILCQTFAACQNKEQIKEQKIAAAL